MAVIYSVENAQGLQGSVTYNPENTDRRWRVSGGVGVYGLVSALQNNPTERPDSEVAEAIAVVRKSSRYIDYLLEKGGVVLPDGTPQKFTNGVPEELAAELEAVKIFNESIAGLRDYYKCQVGNGHFPSTRVLTFVAPGLQKMLWSEIAGSEWKPSLTLAYRPKVPGSLYYLPEPSIQGLAKITNKLVTQNLAIAKLPFSSESVVRQTLFDRSSPLELH